MDKKLLTVVGILGTLVLLYFINLGVQNRYSVDTLKIFSITEDSITKVVISSNQDAIELIKTDISWAISGNDTLQIINTEACKRRKKWIALICSSIKLMVFWVNFLFSRFFHGQF